MHITEEHKYWKQYLQQIQWQMELFKMKSRSFSSVFSSSFDSLSQG